MTTRDSLGSLWRRELAQARTVAGWSLGALGYLLLTCLLTWPLPLHLRTHFLGDPTGDLGNYVWNVWIFRHELLQHAHLPFSTDHIFAYTGGADFSLHNYTPIAGALGVPLIGVLGIVGAFNVTLLAFMSLSGMAVFVLARRLGLGPAGSWSAGALFIASPVLTAKETAHPSLVLAASLPLFLWALLRTLDTERRRDAALVGVLVAAATYSDPYYGVYCAMMGAFLVAWRFCRVEWPLEVTGWRRLGRTLNVVIVLIGTVIAWRALRDTTNVTIGPLEIGLETLYTPLLALALAGALRAWLEWRPVVRLDDPASRLAAVGRLGLVAVCVCLVLLLPQLVGIAQRFASGRLPATETFWRSSPRGLDALAYFVPNPNHAWFGDITRHWLMPVRPDAFPEFVGSFSLGAFAILAGGAWLRILPRFWVVFTGLFVCLSLGPFIHIAGVNTQIVGPWAFLRYVPVLAMARAPSRFAIVGVLGLSLLVGFALEGLRRKDHTPRWALAALVAVLAIELLPAPRRLYSAAVPDVYRLIAATADDESGRLLELPTGIRDGTSSTGNFNASSEFFQTTHRRPLIGGYLSRVSRWRKAENQRTPMLKALFALSEGRALSSGWAREARDSRDAFLRRSCVKFVVVDRRRASPALETFAVEALGLTRIHEDTEYSLFTPLEPPRCDPPLASGPRRFYDLRSWSKRRR